MKKEWVLKKETEMRCELNESSVLVLKLVQGTAEIFGVELALNKEYYFKEGVNIAVYTWYGATIESSGDDSTLYIADSTPMIAYVNTHVQLEAKRDFALSNNDFGPRVMIVGPNDHGKSTTAQILAAYACRLDRTPIYVDLDTGYGFLSIPGCIGAAPLDRSCLCVEDGFTNLTPLVYYFGSHGPKDNVDHYKALVSNLAKKVENRLSKDIDAKSSGIIVDTSGWIEGVGFEVLLHCIQSFSIDIILVMGQDKLFSSLVNAINTVGNNNVLNNSSNNATVVKLVKSGGVVNKVSILTLHLNGSHLLDRMQPLENGTFTYSPERREGIPMSSFIFLKVGGVQLTSGMRVIGDSTHQDTTKVLRVPPSLDLLYHIVAVIHPPTAADTSESLSSNLETNDNINYQMLLNSNVAGFISIVQADIENDRMTILCPCPGALPSNYLLVGNIKWVE